MVGVEVDVIMLFTNNSFDVILVSLKPELFEGLRFDFTKGLNHKFSLSHRYFGVSCA